MNRHVLGLRQVYLLLLITVVSLCSGVLQAQSRSSHQSGHSLQASVNIPKEMSHAFAEGAVSTVTLVGSVFTGGGSMMPDTPNVSKVPVSIAITVSGTASTVSGVIYISAKTIIEAGIEVGSTIVAVVVDGGYMLSAGGKAIAFVANEITEGMMHSRNLTR